MNDSSGDTNWLSTLFAQIAPHSKVKNLGIRASCLTNWGRAYKGEGRPSQKKWSQALQRVGFKCENISINTYGTRCYVINAARACDVASFLIYDKTTNAWRLVARDAIDTSAQQKNNIKEMWDELTRDI